MANYLTDDDEDQDIDPSEGQTALADADVADVPVPDDTPAPTPAPAPAVGDQAPSREDVLKNYLEAKRKGDEDITAAQDKASRLNNIANFGDAIESIFKSNSMAHGGAGVDTDFYKGLKSQGQTGVQQAQAKKNAQVQDYLQQHEIQRQGTQDAMTKGTWEQQQKEGQAKLDAQDPESRQSQVAQRAFKSMYADQPGIKDLDVSDFSASDLVNASKNADVVAKLNEIKATKQMQLAYQQGALKDKRDTKQDALYTEMNNKGLGGRGAPQFVQKAASGIQSGKRALDLINQYPDLNKMPPQQVHLLNTEIDSMAKAGVSTEGGIHGLEANTMQSNWAKFLSSVDGEPTGAQLAPFIQQNKTYLQNMMKTNADAVRDYKVQNYNGYKKRLTPEQDAQYRNDNPEVFKEEMSDDTAPKGQGPIKGGGGQQKVMPAYNHPAADQAKAWALANPNDPRSTEILKRLGTMNVSNSQ